MNRKFFRFDYIQGGKLGMRTKTLCVLFSILFAASLLLDCGAYAKSSGGGGGSRGSSSSGSRSSGSSGYGNSGTKSSTNSSSPSGSGYGNSAGKSSESAGKSSDNSSSQGYGNSAAGKSTSGISDSSNKKSSAIQSQMNRSYSKQESAKAYSDYKAQQSKFRAGASNYEPAGRERATIDSVRSRVTYSTGSDYYTRRTVFYGAYGWSPPVYVYHSYGSFGIWDSMMLWFMLDHIQDQQYAAMYYNHRDDPGMQQFRKELDRLSTENAELKDKVNKLDESAKSLEQRGLKPDPTYVPEDAASVALAATIAEKEIPVKKSSGFPWMWVLLIGSLALIGFMLMRRRR